MWNNEAGNRAVPQGSARFCKVWLGQIELAPIRRECRCGWERGKGKDGFCSFVHSFIQLANET